MTNKLCKVTFLPGRTVLEVPYKTTIMEATFKTDLSLESLCNGKGICGKCLVNVSGEVNEPNDQEHKVLGKQKRDNLRLACKTEILGDVEVTLPNAEKYHTVQNGQVHEYPFDPMILYPDLEKTYGIAIDIGTTSIVVSLVELNHTGAELSTSSCLNPQTKFGGDVVTRISIAHEKPENTKELRACVIEAINELIKKMCVQQNIDAEEIRHISIAGNTTMLHLLMGIDPISLAQAPYTPVFVDYREVSLEDIALHCHPKTVISLLPCLSAFIGADILAGLIAIDFHRTKEPSLFIDVGTNGEIVANVRGKLVATSSAAGPALEGMNIHCGCRAVTGAVSGFHLTDKGEIRLETIEDAPAVGICGSGLVEIVADLLNWKIIDASGRFSKPDELPENLSCHLTEFGNQPAFIIYPESDIILTQKDIRQVQLAKAAIAAAVKILFERLEFELSMVEHVYIAGAFGYHLDQEAVKTIGLIPAELKAKMHFVGNTSKEGARLCLTSKKALEEIQKLQKDLIPLELSYAPEFMNSFIGQMNFFV